MIIDKKEIMEAAEDAAKEVEPVSLHKAMGISDERVIELEKITRDLCRHAPTVADCLMTIATCGNFDDREKVFCTHQWTKGFIAHVQKKAAKGFMGRFKV